MSKYANDFDIGENANDEGGRSSLILASREGHLEVVKTLIEAGEE